MERIRLGISACLLGQRVRYDGQHKLDPFLAETLGRYVEYVPVCPEVECGLPVPRESMRLVGSVSDPRLVTHKSGRDLTEPMLVWARRRVAELAGEGLCGYIFKAKSPSSGMERVKVYDAEGNVLGHGPGLFARAFMAAFPLLPVEDEGRLHDPVLRENFIERVFTLRRYRDAMAGSGGAGALVAFHAAHKFLILSHSAENLRELGRLTAGAKAAGFAAVRGRYEALLLRTLKLEATRRKHANVLQHMLGFLKEQLPAGEKQEMLDLIGQYSNELVPLIVPVTLMAHFARKYDVAYLKQQVYLSPHPLELKLRNHA